MKANQMQVTLHGVRGSRPTHKANMFGYGGNSTSIEFILPGESFYLFLDGGSGLPVRGRELIKQQTHSQFNFLITHTHWDHILGLPFFDPIYDAANTFTFYASATSRANFQDLFRGQNRSDHLPVPSHAIKAKTNFISIEPGSITQLSPTTSVRTFQLNHQGVTLGYRVENAGRSICVITDNAPVEGGNYMGENMEPEANEHPQQYEERFNRGLISFLKHADVVVFDTHFTEDNLKADWGHSTPQRALQFCAEAGVKQLVLFHHAPEENDHDVDNKVASIALAAKKLGVKVAAAKEGKKW